MFLYNTLPRIGHPDSWQLWFYTLFDLIWPCHVSKERGFTFAIPADYRTTAAAWSVCVCGCVGWSLRGRRKLLYGEYCSQFYETTKTTTMVVVAFGGKLFVEYCCFSTSFRARSRLVPASRLSSIRCNQEIYIEKVCIVQLICESGWACVCLWCLCMLPTRTTTTTTTTMR